MALGIFLITPQLVSAAVVYIESSRKEVAVGDTVVITVKINAEGAILNTVDGEISLDSDSKNMVVQEFSLANSAFGLWPRTPSLSSDGKKVTFVGGVPGGFSIEGATVFNIILEAKEEGVMTVSPKNFSVFMNDGQGTKIPVTTKDLSINVTQSNGVVQNDWVSVVTQDVIPPEDFVIVLGKDPALFSGKIFAFFSAVDNQSGIDYYEVSENGGEPVRSGSTYVLQDQSDDVVLRVVAYDKAGNSKVSFSKPEAQNALWLGLAVLIVILVAIGYGVLRIMKRRKMNEQNTPNTI